VSDIGTRGVELHRPRIEARHTPQQQRYRVDESIGLGIARQAEKCLEPDSQGEYGFRIVD